MEITIRYDNDRARCPKCKGRIAYEGTFKRKLPMGFGFAPNSTTFVVDKLVQTGFVGECMDCGQKVLAVKTSRMQRAKPAGINRQIRAAQAATF